MFYFIGDTSPTPEPTEAMGEAAAFERNGPMGKTIIAQLDWEQQLAKTMDWDEQLADLHAVYVGLQQLLTEEMEARMAADLDLHHQMRLIDGSAGQEQTDSSKNLPQSQSLCNDLKKDLFIHLATQLEVERAWAKEQFAEFNSRLEAEVEARCANAEHLDQQVADHKKFFQESLSKMQGQSVQMAGAPVSDGSMSLEALEDKVQRLLDDHSQSLESTNIQVETFCDNVNAVAAEARKCMQLVTTEHEKACAKQESFESQLAELRIKCSSNPSVHGVEADIQNLSRMCEETQARLSSIDSALQEMRQKASSSNKKLAELEDSLGSVTEFFHIQSKIRNLRYTLPSQMGLEKNMRQMRAALAGKEAGHAEPPQHIYSYQK